MIELNPILMRHPSLLLIASEVEPEPEDDTQAEGARILRELFPAGV